MSVFFFGVGIFCLIGQIVIDLVCNVFDVGYCVVDMVQIYGNEVEVGQVIVEFGVLCDELFLIIKIWVDNYVVDKLILSLCDSLVKLCIEYVDLLLIYWLVLGNGVEVCEYMIVLVEVKMLGLICQIGVFNFNIELIWQVIEVVGVGEIVINQIELSFYLQNLVLIVFLQE